MEEKRWCKIVIKEVDDKTVEIDIVGDRCDEIFSIPSEYYYPPRLRRNRW